MLNKNIFVKKRKEESFMISGMPENAYLLAKGKTNFAKNELMTILRKENLFKDMPGKDSEIVVLEAQKQAILNNPDICYTDEEILNGTSKNIDAFASIAETAKSEEVKNFATDIYQLEQSVEDAKIAHEIDSEEFEKALSVAESALELSGMVDDYDGSEIDMTGIANPAVVEDLNKALDEINKEKTASPKVDRLLSDAEKDTYKEIAKHPYKYAMYKAKENIKSIRNDIKKARECVDAQENTLFDSLTSASKSAANAMAYGINNTTRTAMNASMNACKEAGSMLNNAYSKGSEVLSKARNALVDIYKTVMRKVDITMEKITGGQYSRKLENMARRSFVNADNPNKTIGDKLTEFAYNLHAKTRMYNIENTAGYLDNLRKEAWGEDRKSPLDIGDERFENIKFKVAKFGVDAKNVAVDVKDKVVDVTKTGVDFVKDKAVNAKDVVVVEFKKDVEGFKAFKDKVAEKVEYGVKNTTSKVATVAEMAKDKTVYGSQIAAYQVKESVSAMAAAVAGAGVRFYEKAEKVNNYRIDNIIEDTVDKNNLRKELVQEAVDLKLELLNAQADLEKVNKAVAPENKELLDTISALKQIENPTTIEQYTLLRLERQLDEEVFEFNDNADLLSADIRATIKEIENDIKATYDEIDKLDSQISKNCEKIDLYTSRAEKCSERAEKFDEKVHDKFVQPAFVAHTKKEDAISNFKGENSNVEAKAETNVEAEEEAEEEMA